MRLHSQNQLPKLSGSAFKFKWVGAQHAWWMLHRICVGVVVQLITCSLLTLVDVELGCYNDVSSLLMAVFTFEIYLSI